MVSFLRKLFDTSEKDVKVLQPIVEQINGLEPTMQALSDDQLQSKAEDLRRRARSGEPLDDLLPETFAVVREASRRTLGMRQFDVQLLGSMVLHQGRISEMKTGEGKTLVAVAAMVLNALSGHGSHLVTVNDYLARRDAVWMGPIYHFMGLTVGIIQGQGADSDELGGSYRYEPGAMHEDPRYLNLVPCTRREAYECDITYGTNHEFGFDYLRDNMAFDKDDLVMTELHYAIIDEVDSILIDEARTPHIISGPSMEDVSVYKEVDKVVRTMQEEVHFTSDKKNHQASLTEEGMDYVEQMMEIDNIASDPKIFHHVNASVKAYAIFQKDVDYVVRNNEVVIVDENTGRMMFGRRYSDGLHQALEAKEGVPVQRESQTVAVITFQNLFRLYEKLAGMTGTAKTEEDEFRKIYGLDVVSIPTHRPMIRTDQEDTVYKSLDAKFRGISREILRLYTKQQPVLVGTRSIEMSEMVSHQLSADMLQRLLLVDRLFEIKETGKDAAKDLKKEIDAIITQPLGEINRQAISQLLSKCDLPGDPFAKVHYDWFFSKYQLSEANETYLDEALRHGIPHNILNAKFHEREALIIAEAGRKGGVTIATNMAGRGVDILLGGRVADEQVERSRDSSGDEAFENYHDSTYASFRRGGKERAAPPLPLDNQERAGLAEEVRLLGGLYILGTERHESRRIDNQLRGRAGRQGDPGESKFFVSLEDQLWKIFNAKMLENPLLKGWPPLEEVKAGFLSKMIQKTQERIENHFFEARKHVLEYDDVLNSQREHVYGMRRDLLLGLANPRQYLIQGIDEVIEEAVNSSWGQDEGGAPIFEDTELYNSVNEIFPLIDYATLMDLERFDPGPDLVEELQRLAHQAYKDKTESLGDELMTRVEQQVMLRAVNDQWMDHLQVLEYIREGIGLRGYGQVDPLVAYKRETFELFEQTQRRIRDQAVRMIFRAQVRVDAPQEDEEPEVQMLRMEETTTSNGSTNGEFPTGIDPTRVGRNDPCPCGSGKKFKACHYPLLRAQGVI